jgi:hypothetical protein
MSKLNGNVLDVLHEANIEIATPTIMNQRPMEKDLLILPSKALPHPAKANAKDEDDENRADRLAFDKADSAALQEKLESLELGLTEYLEGLRKSGAEEKEIERVEKALQDVLKTQQIEKARSE